MKPVLLIVQLFCCAWMVWSKLECDPTSSAKKPDPNNPESYLYCNLEGTFSKRKCLQGKIFNVETGACESALKSNLDDDPFSQPYYQAPDVCPAGLPAGGGPSSCSEQNPCKEGYECVTTGASQYCCPSRACASARPAITRYYFDVTTGSCRSFQFSQCGGNPNNFNSLEECEGFCLDTQCQHGQAYRVGAVNAVCALTATNTCPQSHSCMSPVFGPSAVCCPAPELTCNEMVSAGTPCFGRSVTIQRFYFDPMTRKCQSFQYYGCNGNGNNFQSMQACRDHCLNSAESACGGAAALMDPNQLPQRCSTSVPCPAGYECNSDHYCCPSSATACSAAMSRGNVCSGSPLRTMWYYDQNQHKCNQFAYNGSSVPGFHMCCSTTGSVSRRPISGYGSARKEPNSLAALIKRCPNGFSCVPSMNPQYHLCCSTGSYMTQPHIQTPQCLRGSAFVDPALNQRQFCSPLRDSCPIGYQCTESDYPGQYICCSQGDLSEQFKGYCPPNQIPYVSREGYPPTCHMQLNPCPTTAPYVCIYSAMKQDSYCCAPIDTTSPSLPDPSLAASPTRRMAIELPSIPTAPPSNPYAGMSQTFPGGPIAPGMGPILPPSLASSMNLNANGNNLPPTLGANVNLNANNLPPTMGANVNLNANNNFNYNNNGYGFPTQNLNGFTISQPPVGIPVGGVPTNIASEVIDRVLSQVTGQNTNYGSNPYMVNNVINSQPNVGHWSNPDHQSFSGCPLGSRALVRSDRSVVTCYDQSCPNGFWCVFAEKENRFQCCSSSSILTSLKRPDIQSLPSSLLAQASSTDMPTGSPLPLECPPGFFLIENKCLKVLFAGQKGCLSDEQCSTREPNATCDSGYCVCPATKPLVHGGKCVSGCPEGFANIAGRCYDPTTVIFMDSVDERTNGTIGGYCLDTLIEEKRCVVENSYCSEKTVTCQCKVGYTLNMDFKNKDDKGSCRQDESSKFIKQANHEEMPAIDDELYFVDIGSNASDAEETTSNSTLQDDLDVDKYLFQTDELITLLA
ncbi:hypothetical protein GCK32_002332 [Trichostrongylus colubriformis]|uniref:Papilin n=1 Tax=Trichostrongylus colubriformis TaxID=6319 RepID=A0AAN8IDJ8_TRICO